ncbi:hypothetical protein [Comamonas flocculans]|uniref:hypothetical protein n=1 Tax=Comamonas flocculans TaxID=2597701 RepID=UPI0021085969|nr:hypothetical protein [Comamonas flocculans]
MPELLLLVLLGLISAVLGRWAGARWRARRHERAQAAARARESRQVRRARERRERD